MSIQHIIQSMKELYNRHEQLLDLSKQKTELVKQGDMEQLQKLLVKERKSIRLAEQAESKRIESVQAWLENNKLPLDDITVTNLLAHVEEKQEKQELEQAAINLAEVMMKLKQQEKLNQDLIQQSMQFVQFSLNLLQPSIENMNYGNKDGAPSVKRSVFDSKA